jgi:hypothetical protein
MCYVQLPSGTKKITNEDFLIFLIPGRSFEKELPYLPISHISQEMPTKDAFLFHKSPKLPRATIGTNQVLL